MNDKFTNIYIGDGLKSLVNPAQSFVLPNLPLVQKEYAPGEGVIITESVDPSVEEEKAFEDSQKKNSEEAKGADGEEEEHEEPEDD